MKYTKKEYAKYVRELKKELGKAGKPISFAEWEFAQKQCDEACDLTNIMMSSK